MHPRARRKRRWRQSRFGLTEAINHQTVNEYLCSAIDTLTERELADVQASQLLAPTSPPPLPPSLAEPLEALSEALTGWLWGEDPSPRLWSWRPSPNLEAACTPRRGRRPAPPPGCSGTGRNVQVDSPAEKRIAKDSRGDDTGGSENNANRGNHYRADANCPDGKDPMMDLTKSITH